MTSRPLDAAPVARRPSILDATTSWSAFGRSQAWQVPLRFTFLAVASQLLSLFDTTRGSLAWAAAVTAGLLLLDVVVRAVNGARARRRSTRER